MKVSAPLVALVATLCLLVIACEHGKNPLETSTSGSDQSGTLGKITPQVLTSHTITLGNFTVEYLGRTSMSDSTRFSYRVTQMPGPAAQMHFRLGFPTTNCGQAPTSWIPANGTTSNTDCCINPGLEWHPSTGSGPFNFSYTYQGNIPEGIVRTSIKSNNVVYLGQIPGPGVPLFDISGRVFSDANKNASFDPATETGIQDVRVFLLSPSKLDTIARLDTDVNGNYLFSGVPCGNYCVDVDPTTVSSTTSSKYMEATTPTSRCISVGPNSTANNFGFAPKTKDLINDLKAGNLTTTGRTATYWRKQLQVAVTGKGSAEISKSTLESYVTQIRALLLVPEPFELPPTSGNGLAAALEILSRPVKTDLEKLTRELLAAEFNYVAGFGVDPALQLVLLGWGEALWASASGISALAAGSSSLGEAVTVFSALNSSGGGGGGRE